MFLPFVSLWRWQKHGWMLDAGSWTSHRRRCLDTARRLQPNSPKLSAVGWKAKSLVFPKQPTGLPLQNDAPTLSFWEWGRAALVSRKPSLVSRKFSLPQTFSRIDAWASRPTGDVHYFSPTTVKSVYGLPR